MNQLNLSILLWAKFLNEGLNEDDKKEGLFKRLKNIEDKNEKQIKSNWRLRKKAIGYKFKIIKVNQILSPKAKELLEKITKERNDIDPKKFVFVKTDGLFLTLMNL